MKRHWEVGMQLTRNEALDQVAERIAKEVRIPPCPSVLTVLVREMRADEPDFNEDRGADFRRRRLPIRS